MAMRREKSIKIKIRKKDWYSRLYCLTSFSHFLKSAPGYSVIYIVLMDESKVWNVRVFISRQSCGLIKSRQRAGQRFGNKTAIVFFLVEYEVPDSSSYFLLLKYKLLKVMKTILTKILLILV